MPGPYHDPDHKRGALPGADARRTELGVVRSSLDTMYAHRLDKEQRNSIDEDKLFAEAEQRLLAATTWAAYDAAIYDALVVFHDDHLTYHPPSTAAPARGYTSYRLGFTTVLAHDHLLVASVEPELASQLGPGDEITTIDGRQVADVLATTIAHRVWSRAESPKNSFARTWTSVLEPVGEQARSRSIDVVRRDGRKHAIAITPHVAVKQKREAVTTALDGDVAVVTIRSLEGNKARAKAIDDALATARKAKAIVLDLRGDRGGIDAVGYRVVADLAEGQASLGTYRVLAAPGTLARRPRWKNLIAGPDGFSPPQDLIIDALPTGFHGPLAVVVDAGCASTCEVVVAALRANVHAIVVGETTGGSSGAPVEVTLPASGGNIGIPTWNLISADGHPIEGDGVSPDVDVVATPDALAAGIDLPLRTAIDRVTASP